MVPSAFHLGNRGPTSPRGTARSRRTALATRREPASKLEAERPRPPPARFTKARPVGIPVVLIRITKNYCTPVDIRPMIHSNLRIRLDTCSCGQDSREDFRQESTMGHPIPEGQRAITPHLVIRVPPRRSSSTSGPSAPRRSRGCRSRAPDGSMKLGHADLQDRRIPGFFLADEFPQHRLRSGPVGSSPVTIHLYVTDANAAFDRAVEAGRDGGRCR